MKLVYVTGCLGFIGSYVTVKCLERGWKVYGVDKCTYVANKNLLLDIPPKNNDSSIRTPQSLKVFITLLSDGADLAVIKAVLIGHSLILNSF